MVITWEIFKLRDFVQAVVVLFATLSFTFFAQASEAKSEAYMKAQEFMKSENYKSAAKVITKAQESGEDNIEMSLLLTDVYASRVGQVGAMSKLGVAKKIKASMEHSLELSPENESALIGISEFHLQAPGIAGGSKTEARKYITKIIELYPQRGHVLMAKLAVAEDNTAEMKTHLEKAVALNPNNTRVLLDKGLLEAEQKNYAEAIATFETCLQIENDNMDCHYQIGKTSQVGKVDYEKGKKAFQDFISMHIENKNYLAYAHYRLGNIYQQEGDKAAAKAEYQLAVDVDGLKKAKKALRNLK